MIKSYGRIWHEAVPISLCNHLCNRICTHCCKNVDVSFLVRLIERTRFATIDIPNLSLLLVWSGVADIKMKRKHDIWPVWHVMDGSQEV